MVYSLYIWFPLNLSNQVAIECAGWWQLCPTHSAGRCGLLSRRTSEAKILWIIESLRQRWSLSLECDILRQSNAKLMHTHMIHIIYSCSQMFSKSNSAWPCSGFLVSGLLFSANPLFGVLLMPMFLLLRPWKLGAIQTKLHQSDSQIKAIWRLVHRTMPLKVSKEPLWCMLVFLPISVYALVLFHLFLCFSHRRQATQMNWSWNWARCSRATSKGGIKETWQSKAAWNSTFAFFAGPLAPRPIKTQKQRTKCKFQQMFSAFCFGLACSWMCNVTICHNWNCPESGLAQICLTLGKSVLGPDGLLLSGSIRLDTLKAK